jgi:hypothetical protein
MAVRPARSRVEREVEKLRKSQGWIRQGQAGACALPGAVFEQDLHIVAQLGAAHDGVFAKEDALAVDELANGDQLHAGHQVAHLLVLGHEAARPGGGVFDEGAPVGKLRRLA